MKERNYSAILFFTSNSRKHFKQYKNWMPEFQFPVLSKFDFLTKNFMPFHSWFHAILLDFFPRSENFLLLTLAKLFKGKIIFFMISSVRVCEEWVAHICRYPQCYVILCRFVFFLMVVRNNNMLFPSVVHCNRITNVSGINT